MADAPQTGGGARRPGRDRVRMDAGQAQAFLEAAAGRGAKLQVATLGADGHPHLTTLFFVVDGGLICFWTYGSTQKIRNLERDDRVSVLVEDGEAYDELRGVSVRGRAEIVRDPDRVRAIGTAVACRMLGVGSPEQLGEEGRSLVARQARKRVGVVVHPERVASWDHAQGSATGR